MAPPKDPPPTPAGVTRAIFNLALAVLFYPAGVIAILWIAWKGFHWGWGALILAAMLVLDPLWLRLAKSLFSRHK